MREHNYLIYEANMSEQLPNEVQQDIDNGFQLTGDHGFQRSKKVGETTYEFKTGHINYHTIVDGNELYAGESNGTVDFSELSDEQIESAISGYYDSVEALREICSGDEESFQFLVCECHYEQELE